VARSARLSQLDLRRPTLVREVGLAFAAHAWVAKVVRVEKRFPAAVTVSLEYRRPVAAVEDGRQGLYYIDQESVLLPSDDFAQAQARDYLRISGGNRAPAGIYGAPWGDDGIAGAARIAAAWDDRFKAAGLRWVVLVQDAGGQFSYELRTAGQTRVLWGRAPGHESSSEPSPEQKIAALLEYVKDKGPLDRDGGQRLIDLVKLAAGSPPRTAARDSAPPGR
jgi:hypothetical protein